MRRHRPALVLGLGLVSLLLTGCSGHGWIVQRYPADSNTNVAAADPMGAALIATRSKRAVAAADAQ